MASRSNFAGVPAGLAIAVAGCATAPLFLPLPGFQTQSSSGQGALGLRGAQGERGPAREAPGNSQGLHFGLALLGAQGLAVAAGASKSLGLTGRRDSERRARTRSAAAESGELRFDPAAQVGAMAPIGYFDPLGFAKEGGENEYFIFRIYRECEIKHGRVAMMASVGLLAQHFVKFPIFEDVPAGIDALNTNKGFAAFVAVSVWAGVAELKQWRQDPEKEAGNFGDPFGIGMYTLEMRNKELNNGRFAMICVMGILGAELATGKDAIQQFGL